MLTKILIGLALGIAAVVAVVRGHRAGDTEDQRLSPSLTSPVPGVLVCSGPVLPSSDSVPRFRRPSHDQPT